MAQERVHATHAREGLDKAVLFIAFAAGVSGTILLKLVEVSPVLVALFPVGVLGAYALACLKLRDIGTEPETIGDNSYYLGFLFTLASLAVTLYRIRDIGAGDADLIPTVISGFGVALSSTIAGVFLRVFLLQLRPDIVARDRAARRDLSAGARDLRDAMAEASRKLKETAVETQQHVAERNNKMSEVIEAQAESTSALLERQSKAFEGVILEFGRRLTVDVTEVLRKEAVSSTEELSKAAESFRENMEAIGESRGRAEKGLASSLDAFRKVVDETLATSEEHRRITEEGYKGLAARAQKISWSLGEAVKTVEEAVVQSRRVVEEANAAAGASRVRTHEDEEQLHQQAVGVTRALREFEAVIAEKTAEVANVAPFHSSPSAEDGADGGGAASQTAQEGSEDTKRVVAGSGR